MVYDDEYPWQMAPGITPTCRTRRDRQPGRRDNITPELRDERQDKVDDRRADTPGALARDKLPGQIPNRPASSNQQLKDRAGAKDTISNLTRPAVSDWKQSSRENNVFSDREGNIFRSNTSTDKWQQLGSNGKWQNTRPGSSAQQQLNTAQRNRESGAERQKREARSSSAARQRPNTSEPDRKRAESERISAGRRKR